MKNNFSDYIIYVDESGDHGLATVDPNYPVFVLAFCIFHKADYANIVVPAIKNFKFMHFGHDNVILHEIDIRRDRKEFSFLKTRELKKHFINNLTELVDAMPFTLICSVIDKYSLKNRYTLPDNPYHIALAFGLERIFRFLRAKNQDKKTTHIIVENRGRREDKELKREFIRITEGANNFEHELPFEIIFADKKTNSSGLQLADLIARPMGLSVLRPQQENRAFNILKEKFYRDATGNWAGWGLKQFP